ncbi:GMC family oxidoreductase [Alkalihalophilus marmarensis]|uniref:GMC family oxidoreductase n=1 Tax=Alkalihalophilus marmarensis TaxID=521377 RepID=UPI002DBAFEAF|nr:GMC family oxidoreductase [Alkalihalophilus marmarensis]MEC2074269.1 GMC family oxidoreductase [Alkalihalophilus marmarensis]
MKISSGWDKSEEYYDIVIVGSGVSGSILSKELASNGLKTLILEGGTGEHFNYFNYIKNLDYFYSSPIKHPNSPYPINPNFPQPNEIDNGLNKEEKANTYFVQKGPLLHLSDYTKILGGTSLHWLGTTLRMLPDDFNTQTNYSIGIDWPLNYEDIIKYYRRAEAEVGVSGSVEDQIALSKILGFGDTWFTDADIFPMHKIPQSYIDNFFGDGLINYEVEINRQMYKVAVTSTPQGRNGIPNKAYRNHDFSLKPAVGNIFQGHRCQGFSSCVPICPIQAKYNSMKTLKAAISTELVDIITQAIAYEIVCDNMGQVTEIKYKAYKNSKSQDYKIKSAKGRVFIIAANAIENSKLLLSSHIGGDKVGKYIMDHPFLLNWGLAPKPLGPFRGPGSTSGIESLRSGKFRSTQSPFRIEISNLGWRWAKGSPHTTVENMVFHDNKKGRNLRRDLYRHGQREVGLGFMLDQPADSNNFITINKNHKDRLGNYKPIINYNLSEYTLRGMSAAREVGRNIFSYLKIEDHTTFSKDEPGYVEYNGEGFNYKGAGHFIGGHIMGSSPRDSVVDSNQKVWNISNLYAIGGGSLPTSGTSNPTLTIAALSFKTADSIIKTIKRRTNNNDQVTK